MIWSILQVIVVLSNVHIGYHTSPTGFFQGFDALTRALQFQNVSFVQPLPFKVRTLQLGIFVGYEGVQYLKEIGLFNRFDWENHMQVIISQVQAIFRHESLSGRLDITVSRLDFHESPTILDRKNGSRDDILDSFCDFQKEFTNYDLGLYLTSLDLYTSSNGESNSVSLGLSPVGGVCSRQDNCVVSEFGTTSKLGKPCPSSGTASAWVIAHEIAHNLGIFHDGQQLNECPPNGFIMSASRGHYGESSWSTCSARMFSYIDDKCLISVEGIPIFPLHTDPGQVMDIHEQCQIFLRDKEAHATFPNFHWTICNESLFCQSPNLLGYFPSGPALEGTVCGLTETCQGQNCLPSIPKLEAILGGWSDWTSEGCKSSCLEDGKGMDVWTRRCMSPKPKNVLNWCPGPSRRGQLCSDTNLCGIIRKRNQDFARDVCEIMSRLIPTLDVIGIQVAHDPIHDWRACIVFCKTKNGTWYSPIVETVHLKVKPVFPDGTKCHENHYCQLGRCMPPIGLVNHVPFEMGNVDMASGEVERVKNLFKLTEGEFDQKG